MCKSEKMAFSVGRPPCARVGRDKIYEAIRNKELEARKSGRRTLITADALRSYLDRLPPFDLPPR